MMCGLSKLSFPKDGETFIFLPFMLKRATVTLTSTHIDNCKECMERRSSSVTVLVQSASDAFLHIADRENGRQRGWTGEVHVFIT